MLGKGSRYKVLSCPFQDLSAGSLAIQKLNYLPPSLCQSHFVTSPMKYMEHTVEEIMLQST